MKFYFQVSSKDDDSDIKPEIENGTGTYGVKKTYTLTHPGATYLSVKFQSMNFEAGCSLTIRDKDDQVKDILSGQGRGDGDFWGRHVTGAVMSLTLECTHEGMQADFLIHEYAAGVETLENRTLRQTKINPFERDLAICASDDKRNAICWKDSFPTEYDKAKTVARMLIDGQFVCTGWLVGPYNYLLTK